MTEKKEIKRTIGYYAEVKAGQFEYDTIIHASNAETAGKIAVGRLDKKLTDYQKRELEDENGKIAVTTTLYPICNMKSAEKYWNSRMLFQDNADGTYTCTDKKLNVVVRFPHQKCKETEVEAIALFDKTTDEEVRMARHLAVVYVNTMCKFGSNAKKVVKEGRQSCFKIDGVHEEFKTMKAVEKYIEENGRGKAFEGKLITRVTKKDFMPMYIIRWDELKQETIIARL